MFYRHGNEIINLSEINLLRKDFLYQGKKFIIQMFFKGGQGTFQFEDEAGRDKTFEDIYKKMEKMG